MNAEFYDISKNVPEGYEFKRLGRSCIAAEVKGGYLFIGTFEEWDQYKKEHPEQLLSHDLINEVV